MFTLQAPAARVFDFAEAGIPGVKVEFAPITRKARRNARRAALALLQQVADDAPDAVKIEAQEEASDAFSAELIRAGIVSWEGIGGPDGKPMKVSPEAIELFIGNHQLFEAACNLYASPTVLAEAEKNASSPARNGTSRRAGPTTATTASRRSGAKPARTSKPSPKPKAAGAPGK